MLIHQPWFKRKDLKPKTELNWTFFFSITWSEYIYLFLCVCVFVYKCVNTSRSMCVPVHSPASWAGPFSFTLFTNMVSTGSKRGGWPTTTCDPTHANDIKSETLVSEKCKKLFFKYIFLFSKYFFYFCKYVRIKLDLSGQRDILTSFWCAAIFVSLQRKHLLLLRGATGGAVQLQTPEECV